jgi:hypothetical protein
MNGRCFLPYKTIGQVVILLMLLAACVQQEGVQQHSNSFEDYKPLNVSVPAGESPYQRVIVLFKSEINEKIIQDVEGVVLDKAETISMVTAFVPVSKIDLIKKESSVTSVEPDKLVEVMPAQMVEWGAKKVQAPSAWASDFTGKSIKIAVVDSGIETTHEDLKIAGGVSFVDYTTSYNDDNGHGTHVAGIIGAKNNQVGIVGVAPDSELYAVKVLDQNGVGYLSDLLEGIDWCIENNIDIINLSLGRPEDSQTMKAVVNKAYENNNLVVAAAGNSGTAGGTETNITSPARYESVIAVGAVDENNVRANFSSTGPTLEIAAPGVNIVSTYMNNKYAASEGTSMAAPFAAGVLALLKESNENKTAVELRTLLQKGAADIGEQGRDTWYGFGLVQAPFVFRDIYGHWASNDILNAYEKRWMVGKTAQIFSPNESLTRAQAAVVLTRMLSLTRQEGGKPFSFTDVPADHWARNELEIIFQHNIMKGTAENTFSPNETITREQMAVMLRRILNVVKQSDMQNPFYDIKAERWSYEAVVTLNHIGILKGMTEVSFVPKSSVTRAQMASILSRINSYKTNSSTA